MELKLLSVNVGRPTIIGHRDGKPVRSAIGKQPVLLETIAVRALGLDGDRQANTLVHGGIDKAVYAYASDHWPWWEGEKNFPCRPGAFGENLTLEGADETKIRIGDRFAWGEALLEVSQPRSPCSNFQIYSGREDASVLMTLSGRCGWYCRVLQEGEAPTRGAVLKRVHTDGSPSVREAFFAYHDKRTAPERRRLVADAPALSAAWRRKLA